MEIDTWQNGVVVLDDALLQRTNKFIASTNDCLKGSPYQFPEDEGAMHRYQQIEQSLTKIQEKLGKVPDIEGVPSTLKRSLRTQEVFESNALEGLGTDLATTDNLIEGTTLERKSSKDYVEWAITRGIQNDKHFYDVIGLTAARALSRDIAKIVDRPITESDIRTIHEVILANEEFAGIYKLYPNSISGDNPHQTTLPTDTPGAMQQFIDWVNGLSRRGSRTSLSVVKAAAIHAWLTHIHPFHDGNGRLARLLANMILAREEMPPLILRNEAHRGRYLDALSFSDSGGDISKLILVFCRAIERVIDDMLDPKLAQQMFEQDINLRLSGEFKNWDINLNNFQIELEAALLFHRLSLTRVGGLSPSEFKALQKGRRTYKTWWAEIKNSGGEDIALLYFGFMPDWTRNKLERDEIYPCLYFSARNGDKHSLKKYLRPEKDWMRRGHTHVVPQPLEQRAYIWGENSATLQKVTYAEAAKQIALTCSEYSLNPL